MDGLQTLKCTHMTPTPLLSYVKDMCYIATLDIWEELLFAWRKILAGLKTALEKKNQSFYRF